MPKEADGIDMGRQSHKVRKIQACALRARKVDAIGFGVLHFSSVSLFGARRYLGLRLGRNKAGAVFASGLDMVVDAFHVEAAFADPSVVLLFVNWVSAVAKMTRLEDLGATHFWFRGCCMRRVR